MPPTGVAIMYDIQQAASNPDVVKPSDLVGKQNTSEASNSGTILLKGCFPIKWIFGFFSAINESYNGPSPAAIR